MKKIILSQIALSFVLISCQGKTTKKSYSIPDKPSPKIEVLNNNVVNNNTQTPIKQTNDSSYFIGDYLINTKSKTVSIRQMYGKGDVGTRVGYFPDKRINYETTSLIILGNQVLFKEYFPTGVDFNSLKYIVAENGLYKDKNFVYWYPPNYLSNIAQTSDKTNISGYTCINDYIYEDKSGALYFLNTNTNNNKIELTKITDLPNLDKATLKHLQGQYFADKNGLYAFGVHFLGAKSDDKKFSQQAKCFQVESANGKNITPIITRNYIVYNKSVYAGDYSVEKLKLDINKMIEVRWRNYQNIYFITDGTNLYETETTGYAEDGWNKHNDYATDFFKSGNRILKVYTPQVKFAQNKDLKTLYFKNAVQGKTGLTEKLGVLIKTDKGYFFDAGWPHIKPQKIENIIIYNYALKKNEAFDESQFLSIDEDMYAYKGLIFFDEIPLKEVNGPQHFKFLTGNGIKTNFITNDDMLIAYGNIGGYQSDRSDGTEKIVFEKRIKRGIDIAKLKVINANLLVDDDNFYDCSGNQLNIIPIKKLGLPVKLLLK